MPVFPRLSICLALAGTLLSAVPPVCAATAGDHGRRIAALPSGDGGMFGGLVAAEIVTALKDDGTLLEWGRSPYDGPPMRIGRMSDARSITAGVWGVAVVKGDGTVAMRSHDASESFKTVAGLDNVVDVKVGQTYAFALKSDGTVWGWGFYTGNNGCAFGERPELISAGPMGCIYPRTFLPPAPVPGATNVAEIDITGGTTVFYRKHDGSVWINGDDYGSDPHWQPYKRAVLMQVPGLGGIVSISASRTTHVVALKADGTVWMWGTSDTAGNAPNGTIYFVSAGAIQIPGLSRIVKIANGRNVLALREDGALFQFGGGQGAVPDTSPNAVPFDPTPDAVLVRVTALANLDAASVKEMYSLSGGGKIVVKSDGTVWGWDDGAGVGMGLCNFGRTAVTTARAMQDHDCRAPLDLDSGDPPALPENIRPALALTHKYLAAVDAAGRVWATNEAGTDSPVRLRDASGFGYLNLADGGSAQPDILFARTSSNADSQLVLLSQSGKVYQCWVGSGTDSCIRRAPLLDSAVAIGGGGAFVSAVKADGSVWAWGQRAGRNYDTPTRIAELDGVATVAKTQGDGLAMKRNGTVWSWTQNPAATRQIQIDGAVAVAGGAGANYVLRNDGSVWAWGRNSFGELGSGQSSATWAESPARVPGLDAVAAIAAGDTGASTIRGDGSLWSFGANYGGVLGIGSNGSSTSIFPPVRGQLDGLAAIAAGPNSMAAITQNGKVWVWGKNIVTPTPVKGSDGDQMDLATATLPVPALGSSGNQTPISAESRLECLFAWAETVYPLYFAPAGSATHTAAPYRYRYYAGSGAYLGAADTDNHLYYLGPISGGALLDLGDVSSWQRQAGCP